MKGVQQKCFKIGWNLLEFEQAPWQFEFAKCSGKDFFALPKRLTRMHWLLCQAIRFCVWHSLIMQQIRLKILSSIFLPLEQLILMFWTKLIVTSWFSTQSHHWFNSANHEHICMIQYTPIRYKSVVYFSYASFNVVRIESPSSSWRHV